MDFGTWIARSIRTDSPGQCSHRGAQKHREQFDPGLIGLPFRHTFALETGQGVQKNSTWHSGSRSGLPPRLRFHANASSRTLQAAPISSSDPQSTPSSSRNPTALSFAFMADFTEAGKSSANTIFIKGNSSNLPAGRGGAIAEDWHRIHPGSRASAYLHRSSLMNPDINWDARIEGQSSAEEAFNRSPTPAFLTAGNVQKPEGSGTGGICLVRTGGLRRRQSDNQPMLLRAVAGVEGGSLRAPLASSYL